MGSHDLPQSIPPSSETSDPSAPQPKPSRRRDKPQLSCNLCRRRKLRCDRVQPCANCIRRGLAASCTYVDNGPARSQGNAQTSQSSRATLLDRISQLEGMVTGLMGKMSGPGSNGPSPVAHTVSPPAPPSSSQQAERPPDQTGPPLSDSFGRISLENAESSYVEKDHWTAILDEIADLKDCFEDEVDSSDHQTPSTNASEVGRQDLLFGQYVGVNKKTLVEAVPERAVCDKLVATYFASMEISPLILHRPTFLKEYDKFWLNQMEVPTMWLGLLFAILCVATMTNELQNRAVRTPDFTSEPYSRVRFYREKVGQCLCLAEYMKGGAYTVETLVVYLFAEYGISEDSRVEIWLLLGIIIRLALRLGYHRDGSHSSRLSAFQAEMRRRVWTMIYQFDVLMAAQFGLPRMIREAQTDTQEPSNLVDEDLDENLLALPEARPPTELTHVQFIVMKGRLVSMFGSIIDAATSINLAPHSEIMALDKRLLDIWDAVPGPFHLRLMTEMIYDPPGLIFGRMILILIFHKCQCVLHRKYMVLARTDQRYLHSRNVCIGAALKTLELQATMSAQTEQNGKLYDLRWRFSSITKQEFLLATTILCLEIDHSIRLLQKPDPREISLDEITKAHIITALNTSYPIWLKSSTTSQEAKKAAQAVRIVLGKLQSTRPASWWEAANQLANLEEQLNRYEQQAASGPKGMAQTPEKVGNDASHAQNQDALSQQPILSIEGNDASMGRTFYGMYTGNGFEMNDWSTDYQDMNLDDFLDMPEWAGLSQFPFGANNMISPSQFDGMGTEGFFQ